MSQSSEEEEKRNQELAQKEKKDKERRKKLAAFRRRRACINCLRKVVCFKDDQKVFDLETRLPSLRQVCCWRLLRARRIGHNVHRFCANYRKRTRAVRDVQGDPICLGDFLLTVVIMSHRNVSLPMFFICLLFIYLFGGGLSHASNGSIITNSKNGKQLSSTTEILVTFFSILIPCH